MFDVVITPSAELDIQENYRWWYDNRSQEQAIRWYIALFGLGRLPSDRVIFVIADQQVVVLCVPHVSQSDLTRNDLL